MASDEGQDTRLGIQGTRENAGLDIIILIAENAETRRKKLFSFVFSALNTDPSLKQK